MDEQLEHDASWNQPVSFDTSHFGPDGAGGRMDGTFVPGGGSPADKPEEASPN